MSDMHEATFVWDHSDAKDVIVTGSFDQWSHSLHLKKVPPAGFEGTVRVPWDEKIYYKFLVDGQWTIKEGEPTEVDHLGNVNNVYHTPSKPALSSALDPIASNGIDIAAAASTVAAAVASTLETASTAAQQAIAPAIQAVADNTPITSDALPAEPKGTQVDTEEPVVAEVKEKVPVVNGINGHAEEPATVPVDTPVIEKPAEITTEAILPEVPQVVLTDIPVPVLPIVDSTTTEKPADALPPTDEGVSTHTPAVIVVGDVTSAVQPEQIEQPAEPVPEVVAEKAVETKADVPAAEPVGAPASTEAAPADKVSVTPPVPTEAKPEVVAFPSTETPKKPSPAPATPSKSLATNGSGTPSAPTTPVKYRFPTEDGDDGAGSIRSKGSARKKRDSIFGKIKRVFSHHKEGSEHN